MRHKLWALMVEVESCKIVFLGALPIHMFRHFCCSMCLLDIMHTFTVDRQKDRHHGNSSAVRSTKTDLQRALQMYYTALLLLFFLYPW